MTNNTGITPYLDRVLVKPDPIETETEGGIVLPEQVKKEHQHAQAIGTLIAVGPDAYVHSRVYVKRVVDGEMQLTEIRTEQWDPEFAPKAGDRVLYSKHNGLRNEGTDGELYLVMNDRDITALVEDGVTYTGIQARKAVT